MKFFRADDNIINLAAVRNMEIDYNGNVKIHFLNPTDRDDYAIVYCRSKKEAKEVINIVFDMMGKSDEEKVQKNY